MGGGREAHGKENPRELYAVGLRTEPAPLVRGSYPVAKDLLLPENIRLLRLPAYAPELNPQGDVWDEVREKEFPNRVFCDLASVSGQLERGLAQLAADHERLGSITAQPWIVSLILNAN